MMRESTTTTKTWVHKVDELPVGEHYAVLVNDTITYDDGYGSRGSPSTNTKEFLTYMQFPTIEAVTAYIREEEANALKFGGYRKTYKVLLVKPLEIVREVSIKVQ
jgi:hypothetical protein